MNNLTTNELILKALEQVVNNPIAVELAKRLDDVIQDNGIEVMTMVGQLRDVKGKAGYFEAKYDKTLAKLVAMDGQLRAVSAKAEYFEAKYEKEYMENQRLQAQLDSDEQAWVELEKRVNTLEEGKKSC